MLSTCEASATVTSCPGGLLGPPRTLVRLELTAALRAGSGMLTTSSSAAWAAVGAIVDPTAIASAATRKTTSARTGRGRPRRADDRTRIETALLTDGGHRPVWSHAGEPSRYFAHPGAHGWRT